MVDQIGVDRLLFGTDASLIDPSYALAAIEAARLSDPERSAILEDNATRLFDLGACPPWR